MNCKPTNRGFRSATSPALFSVIALRFIPAFVALRNLKIAALLRRYHSLGTNPSGGSTYPFQERRI